jgi:Mce-associated membrane protein
VTTDPKDADHKDTDDRIDGVAGDESIDVDSTAEALDATAENPEATVEDLDEGTEVLDGEDETSAEAKPERGRFARLLMPLVLAVLLLASAGLASWVYMTQYRVDRQTSGAVAAETLKAATDGTVALLSYKPDTLDADLAAAKTHLTGHFLDYYSKFTQEIVEPAAKKKGVTTSAAVVNAAVSELNPGSAVVLVFVNQTTMSKENPDGSFTSSAVKVGLTRDGGGPWLISTFDPV